LRWLEKHNRDTVQLTGSVDTGNAQHGAEPNRGAVAVEQPAVVVNCGELTEVVQADAFLLDHVVPFPRLPHSRRF
jgi:hypothetical protein